MKYTPEKEKEFQRQASELLGCPIKVAFIPIAGPDFCPNFIAMTDDAFIGPQLQEIWQRIADEQ
jgi:hypothetical protein